MDYIYAFLLIALFAGAVTLVYYLYKGKTGETATSRKKLAAIAIIGGLIGLGVWYPATFAFMEQNGDQPCPDGYIRDEVSKACILKTSLTTSYQITPAYDSTTATDADFSLSDECGAAAGELTINEAEKTILVRNTADWSAETATAGNGSTCDVISISNAIIRDDPSEWNEGARVTSSMWLEIGDELLDWQLQSSNVSGMPMIKMYARNTWGLTGLLIADGAGVNNLLGSRVGGINEFSPFESNTGSGEYIFLNERESSLFLTFGTYIFSTTLTFKDDMGFSETWTLVYSLTVQE